MQKPLHEVALALVRRDDLWLVARRRQTAHLGGAWEFPGGKHHAGETIIQTALRELAEECGVHAVPDRVLEPVVAEYEDRVVRLTAVLCRWLAGDGHPLESEECRWVTAAELRALAMPAVNAGLIGAAIGPI